MPHLLFLLLTGWKILLRQNRVKALSNSKKYGVGLLFCLLGHSALGQKTWTLAECLAFAQTHNLQIQQAGLLQDKSIVQLSSAKNAFLPTVNARVRTTGNWGFLIDPSTNQLSDQFNFGNQAAVNFNLNVFNSFATSYQVKLRSQQVAAATYASQASKNNISLEVLYSFLQVLLSQEQLSNSRQRGAFLREQHRNVKAQIEKGVLSKRDELSLQAQIAEEGLLTIYAENSVEKALFTLRQVMGLPLTDELAIQPVDIPEALLTTERTREEVLAASLPAMPDLKAAEAQIQAAQYAGQALRASYKPSLALTGQLGTRTSNYKPEGFNTQVLDNLNRRVGLALNVPLFNRFQLRSTDQLTKLEVASAKLNYQQVDQELKGKVMSAWLDYKAAAKKYQALQLQQRVIGEEHRYATKLLAAGGIDGVQYSVTRSLLVAAQSELVQAKYDCFFKHQMLAFYQGESLALTF